MNMNNEGRNQCAHLCNMIRTCSVRSSIKSFCKRTKSKGLLRSRECTHRSGSLLSVCPTDTHFYVLICFHCRISFPWKLIKLLQRFRNTSKPDWRVQHTADDILIICFLIFFQKTDFDISCKLSPKETLLMKDNFHEMSTPIFFENRKIFQNVVCWNFYPAC